MSTSAVLPNTIPTLFCVTSMNSKMLSLCFLLPFGAAGAEVPAPLTEASRIQAAQTRAAESWPHVRTHILPIYESALKFLAGDANGTGENPTAAVNLFRKAAILDYVPAQNQLGNCLAIGEGVFKDEVEAYKWYLLASWEDDPDALKSSVMMEGRLTKSEIADGLDRACKFKPESLSSAGSYSVSHPSVSHAGFFITEDGYFVSKADGAWCSKIRIVTVSGLSGASLLHAKFVKRDETLQWALFKVEGKFSAVPVVTSRALKLGDPVATVGFFSEGLQRFSPALTKGKITGLSGVSQNTNYFQIDVPVRIGNYGGALIDEQGNAVGVVGTDNRENPTAEELVEMLEAFPSSQPRRHLISYAFKADALIGLIRSVPELMGKLKSPNLKTQSFEELGKSVERATVLMVAY